MWKMENIEQSGECKIPHILTSDGVRITSTCSQVPLRLTDEHLVFTANGLRRAGEKIFVKSLFL